MLLLSWHCEKGDSMITVKDKTTIAGISELRSQAEKILSSTKDHNVILERHNKPVVVMINYKQYETFEKMLDFAEDYVLGMLALERDKKSARRDFVDIDKW